MVTNKAHWLRGFFASPPLLQESKQTSGTQEQSGFSDPTTLQTGHQKWRLGLFSAECSYSSPLSFALTPLKPSSSLSTSFTPPHFPLLSLSSAGSLGTKEHHGCQHHFHGSSQPHPNRSSHAASPTKVRSLCFHFKQTTSVIHSFIHYFQIKVFISSFQLNSPTWDRIQGSETPSSS